MAQTFYWQLTGKHRQFHLFSQLWIGPDHLLLVRSNRFEESYQRFYYKDIQALVVTGLESRTWMQAGFAILSATMILLALTLIPIRGWAVVATAFGLIPGLAALADYLGGPRCRMILKTPGSNEVLPPVSRMKVAKQVIDRLKPIVENAQKAQWTPEILPSAGPPVMAPRPATPPPADRILIGLFALLTADAAIGIIGSYWHPAQVLVLLIYTIITEIALAIAALKRRGDDPRWLLYSLSGVSLVCSVLDVFAASGLLVYFIFVVATATQAAPSAPAFFAMPYPRYVLIWAVGWRLLAAATGWIAFVWNRKADATAPFDEGGPPSLL